MNTMNNTGETFDDFLDMAIELAKIGVILDSCVKDDNDKYTYKATLPFNFEIKDEDGKIYTHKNVATKAKNIIKKFREEMKLTTDIFFSYKLRDDTFDEDLRDHMLDLLMNLKK